MPLRRKSEVRKVLKEFNKRHSSQFKIHNSPIGIAGETEQKKFSRFKWLERGAGFIQALAWVLDPGKDLPEWVNWFGKRYSLEEVIKEREKQNKIISPR